jgi:hypothetical protein
LPPSARAAPLHPARVPGVWRRSTPATKSLTHMHTVRPNHTHALAGVRMVCGQCARTVSESRGQLTLTVVATDGDHR